LVKQIEKNFNNYDIIAGVATGAIGIGMLVANKLNKPFIYVRSDRKKHGRKNSVEGYFKNNQKVVVIEDLISTGKSSLEACDSLIAENLKVKGLVSIFNYNFDISKNNFQSKQIKYHSLCSYNFLIEYAAEENYISKSELEQLEKWRSDPENWNK
jgi:orotate phosphoribosyltransferase